MPGTVKSVDAHQYLLLRLQEKVMGVEHGNIGCATTDAYQVPLVSLRTAGTPSETASSAG